MEGANALLKLLPARALPSYLAHRHACITNLKSRQSFARCSDSSSARLIGDLFTDAFVDGQPQLGM